MNKELEGKIKQIVGEAVGYGSLCWEPRPVGVFNSTEASKAADEAASRIAALMPEPLAVLADRKGYWFLTLPPYPKYNQPKWEISLAISREYKGVYSAIGDTYPAAEQAARRYLESLPDKGDGK